MHFSFNLLRIKSLYMFWKLLSHPQEALHMRHLVYCVRVMSVEVETSILVQPPDVTSTKYTKCRLWSASWGWASNARNMYRPLILNKFNKECITLVSLYWYSMIHDQQNINSEIHILWSTLPFHNIQYLLWQWHLLWHTVFVGDLSPSSRNLPPPYSKFNIDTHQTPSFRHPREPQFVHWPQNGPHFFPTILLSFPLSHSLSLFHILLLLRTDVCCNLRT
jgi:hypothetical protein